MQPAGDYTRHGILSPMKNFTDDQYRENQLVPLAWVMKDITYRYPVWKNMIFPSQQPPLQMKNDTKTAINATIQPGYPKYCGWSKQKTFAGNRYASARIGST